MTRWEERHPVFEFDVGSKRYIVEMSWCDIAWIVFIAAAPGAYLLIGALNGS